MKSRLFTLCATTVISTFIGLSIVSCNKDDDNTTPADNTITGKVVDGANFTVLEKAVIKAGLNGTLSGTGPFTVFAPDDAAFSAAGITSASIDALSADQLQRLLLYHTLPSRVLAADVPAGPNAKISTANSPADSIFVTRNANGVYVNGVKVVTADVAASNGVIHVLAKALNKPAGNIVATAQANLGGDNGLDSLVNAVVRAGAASPALVTLVNTNVLTVFAPTNKAFRDLLPTLGASNISQIPIATLTAVLSYHLRGGRAFSSDLSNGSLPMFAGGNTTINLSATGATIKGTSNTTASNILATDVMASNGVVHLIDRVLLP
ncbi:fasciclin domain-containing protein [Segetibacter sp. 3557_3]|uniref:fasciclin domain-containing protein n=1 Tax=Segetibacter sp. 3557_3 TaxID=2547429 RepID=UPI001058DE28|nr:fasciclin domain-containing protein [Segetibacter sp. 3557_3]TDH26929.1 fasciclin domain-containing protein [Segetibacter sp. 3557_3]